MAYFYGPVLSKRLGFSLGVDVIPRKVCSFDCVYCQLGKTTKKTVKRQEFVDLKKFEEELKTIVKRNLKIDYITFSGSGEPTLHKNLDRMIDIVKKITKNKYPVCVITNSSLLWKKEVRYELKKADLIIPSLDAGTSKVFLRINRPHSSVSFKKLVEGLILLRKDFPKEIWLEIMLVKGMNTNMKEIERIKRLIEKILPDRIHLNLPTRLSPDKIKLPLHKDLLKIRDILGERAEVVDSFHKYTQKRISDRGIKKQIYEFLKRRPTTLDELVGFSGLGYKEVRKYLNLLLEEEKIKQYVYQNKHFFVSL